MITHLWQSTLCVAAAWLLTFVLNKNRASLRYWLWLAASAKFLIPFSLFVTIGTHVRWRSAPAAGQPLWMVIDNVSRSLSVPSSVLQPAALPPSNPLPLVLFVVWIVGLAVVIFLLARSWRQIHDAQRRAIPLPLRFPIPVLESPSRLEPGVFGIRKPVLLLPAGIAETLSSEQLDAILAHELCHVRRRDNLTAAIHLVAETIFWFFPPLWWIRTRLVEERERACDEEVLQLGTEPRAYAEGILKVCEFYLHSPIVCVAGVTGANLKQRIEAIVENQIAHDLNIGKKLLLTAAALVALAVPFGIGMLKAAPTLQVQSPTQRKFDVASIKPSSPDARMISFQPIDGGINITNVPVGELIVVAYRIQLYQLSGGPPWMHSDHYDISAKSETNPRPQEIPLMLQGLLADRFKLSIHHETKQLPIYALLVARQDGKLGPKLVESKEHSCTEFDPVRPRTGALRCGGLQMRPNALTAASAHVGDMTQNFSRLLGRTVVDKTGLTGTYDINLEWTPDESPSDPAGSSIFTAIQEQLGLKLEAQKGPVETIVIDHLEKPSAN